MSPSDMRVYVRKFMFWYVAKCIGYPGVDFVPPRCWTRSLSKQKAVEKCRQKGFNSLLSAWEEG